eukprot:11900508-Ditylum_brightwellii.AAC.1
MILPSEVKPEDKECVSCCKYAILSSLQTNTTAQYHEETCVDLYGRHHESLFLQHHRCLRRSGCGRYSDNDASLPQSRKLG